MTRPQRYRMVMGVVLGLALALWLYQRQATPLPVHTLACADLVAGCGTPGLQLQVDQAPRVMRPFTLHVETEATAVHASFAMAGMAMGLNRYRLVQRDGHWQAQVTLPVCVQGRSDWQLVLELDGASGVRRYQLGFQASR